VSAIATGQKLATRAEIAPMLRLSPRKVSELTVARIVPCIRINRKVTLYHYPTVIAALTKQKP
jgi:elongation factor P--beta-lysine ligase